MTRVVVIGAGLAGLTCARLLLQEGVDVAVLEASDGERCAHLILNELR